MCAIVDIVKEKKLSLSNPDVTQFDLAVMDSVYTLAVSGIMRFTPEDVARIMSGNLEQNLTPKKIKEVKESIEKLSFIRLTIDYTDEMIARGEVKPGKRTFELESYMVPVRKIEIKSRNNQTKLTGYQLLEMPILYQYAEKTHQIAGVPLEILNTPSIGDTNDVIVIKRALIRRIEAIKNPRNSIVSESIIYERVDHTTGQITGFFAKLGFFESDSSNKKQWNKKRAALHKTVISILDDFKEKGYIAGYELVREGRKVKRAGNCPEKITTGTGRKVGRNEAPAYGTVPPAHGNDREKAGRTGRGEEKTGKPAYSAGYADLCHPMYHRRGCGFHAACHRRACGYRLSGCDLPETPLHG